MAFETYVTYKPHKSTLDLIEKANAIIDEYLPQGLRLTVRQLFYQFVARAFIKNTQKEYKNLVNHISNARDGGLIDWDAIEDRTREVDVMYGWTDPAARISAAAVHYRENPWLTQPYHVEVWIEKEALLGVIEAICEELRVPYCAHRGSASTSLVRDAGKRFAGIIDQGRKILVLHLTDHDPTGLDMTRDLEKRFALYARQPIKVKRIALTREQVTEYEPPPNTAKEDDTRYATYVAETGSTQCWELDALPPDLLVDLIRSEVQGLIDEDAWDAAMRREARNRDLLVRVAQNWTKVEKAVRGK